MASRVRSFRVDDELMARVDAVRGEVSRSAWVVGALEAALGAQDGSGRTVGRATAPRCGQSPTPDGEKASSASPRASEPRFIAFDRESGEGAVYDENGERLGGPVYRCGSCSFVARSPNARCPRHPGRLVAG